MRIKTFCKLIEVSGSQQRKLRDETVVIDAHSFFFLTYEESGLNYALGCECDRYADYLRECLSMFNKANIKCKFLFKGGFADLKQRIEKINNPPTPNLKRPIFTKNVIMEILNESNFEYVVCEYESKTDVIELSERLNCPIISFDVEYCFSGLPYISLHTLKYNKSDNTIDCKVFLLEHFLREYNLTMDKLATFIVLTDEYIFPKDFFKIFFLEILNGRCYGYFKRNKYLLNWLSESSRHDILRTVFKYLFTDEEKEKFDEEQIKARKLIDRRESGGLGAACLLDAGAGRVARADPRWFAKGVAAGHVNQEYVDLYRSNHFYGSKVSADKEKDDAMFPSLEIVKYAFDLLTNFQNAGFELDYDTDQGKETMVVGDTYSITKPVYEAEQCVFENGWESVRALGLLEHFSRSALQLDSLRRLSRAPAQARLLLLALAYCARRRPAAPAALPAAALLAHIVLDVVADKCDRKNLPKLPFDRKPILDSTTDISDVTDADCGIAAAIMDGYFNASDSDIEFLDRRLLHALAEFQQCLLQLSALNALCGRELPAPVLARTYNGTLAYNLLRAADRAHDRVTFLDELLSPAPTLYAYYNGLYEIYDDLLFFRAHEIN